MKLLRTASVLVLTAFALTACDDEEVTGVQIADLAGMWNATQFEYADNANPSFSINAVSSTVGGTVTLDVAAGGGFSGTISVPGLTVNPATGETITVPISGTLSINGETLSVTFDQETLSVVCPDPVNSPETCLFESFDATFELNGDVLTFVNDDTTFDFNDGLEQQAGLEVRGAVPATLSTRWER